MRSSIHIKLGTKNYVHKTCLNLFTRSSTFFSKSSDFTLVVSTAPVNIISNAGAPIFVKSSDLTVTASAVPLRLM